MLAITATPQTPLTTTDIRGTLTLSGSAFGVRPCIGFRELAVGETMFAAGFRTGGNRRRVLATRVQGGHGYVLVSDGWYQWDRVYAQVL